MATKTMAFETEHEEMIHDAQLDYYGKRLATASSDRTIKVFDIVGNKHNLVAHLKGHDGPVWQVAWAHPKFGTLIASASYDRKVIIWREEQNKEWKPIFQDDTSSQSVMCVAWAPHAFGLILATGSADGNVTIFTHKDRSNNWESFKIKAHNTSCNAVSWGPDASVGALLKSGGKQTAQMRFVTAGCDNTIRMFGFNSHSSRWEKQEGAFEDKGHDDWVRDVAWAPSLGLLSNTIASCSEDRTVKIWTEQNGRWRNTKTLPKFNHTVWKVSWSVMGNILAVTQGDNKVSLWKESIDGQWENVSNIDNSDQES